MLPPLPPAPSSLLPPLPVQPQLPPQLQLPVQPLLPLPHLPPMLSHAAAPFTATAGASLPFTRSPPLAAPSSSPMLLPPAVPKRGMPLSRVALLLLLFLCRISMSAMPEDALARRLCAEPPRSDSCSRLQRLRTASSERPGSCAAITRQRQPSFSTPLRMSASSSALHSLRGSADTCIRRLLVESAAVVASYFLLALMSAAATTAGAHRGLRAEGDAPEGSTFTLGCESAWVPELKPSKRHALTSASMEGDQDAS